MIVERNGRACDRREGNGVRQTVPQNAQDKLCNRYDCTLQYLRSNNNSLTVSSCRECAVVYLFVSTHTCNVSIEAGLCSFLRPEIKCTLNLERSINIYAYKNLDLS